jgi:hypothetical protein
VNVPSSDKFYNGVSYIRSWQIGTTASVLQQAIPIEKLRTENFHFLGVSDANVSLVQRFGHVVLSQ